MPPKLGIIAGAGPLPGRLVAAARAEGREVHVLGIRGEADLAALNDVPHETVGLGAVDLIIQRLRAFGAEDVILAGPVRRPALQLLQTDRRGRRLIARAIAAGAKGDDGILRAAIRELEGEGFRVLGADALLGPLLAGEGVHGRASPDEAAWADIAQGRKVLACLGDLDVGQAVVVQQGVVLAIEAREGTDALLERCRALRLEGAGGVLVKLPKVGQDRRADLPTIGPGTAEGAVAAGLVGIAVEVGGCIIVAREPVVERLNAAGLFLIGLSPEPPPPRR